MVSTTITCDFCGGAVETPTMMSHTIHIEMCDSYQHKDICETCLKKLRKAGGAESVGTYIKNLIDSTELDEEVEDTITDEKAENTTTSDEKTSE